MGLGKTGDSKINSIYVQERDLTRLTVRCTDEAEEKVKVQGPGLGNWVVPLLELEQKEKSIMRAARSQGTNNKAFSLRVCRI